MVTQVAPLVGAWIEIYIVGVINGTVGVAPLVGAWIEIAALAIDGYAGERRSPCGSVD